MSNYKLMSIAPRKIFVNNEIPLIFNVDTFKTNTVNSDNLTGLSLIVEGQSDLNNVDVRGTLDTINIVNTGSITSNTMNSVGLLTASNGFTVSTGPVSFPANSIPSTAVTGVFGRLGANEANIIKAQNPTNGPATNATIVSNVLTIDYAANNNQTIFVVPTANFSLVLTNVPTTNLYGMYSLNIRINARFFCNGQVTVNGGVVSTVGENGLSNIVINTSAVLLFQTFKILFVNGTTPTRVLTEVINFW